MTPLELKKLHVLAALEIEQYFKTQRFNTHDDQKNEEATELRKKTWHAAEAYHYYMLAQRQYYSGSIESALKTVFFTNKGGLVERL